MSSRPQRARYSNYVKDQVKRRYPLCRTTADKEALAAELEIGSVAKLYNLASRLGATGKEAAERYSHAAASDESRMLSREDPKTTTLNAREEGYLKEEFGRRTTETISFHLGHTETAVLYFARRLGLRRPVKFWDVVKVSFWLGVDVTELDEFTDGELDIFPFEDPRSGRTVKEVVSTTSLARWMAQSKNLKRLRGVEADEFFIKEIQESVQDIINRDAEFERCKFLSADHVCMNSYALSFGLFCTNTDRQNAGEDPNCSARTLDIDDLRAN